MSRPVIVRASRKAETCEGMAEEKLSRFASYSTPLPSDVAREVSALKEAATLFRYFAAPDRMAFGHLIRLRDAGAALRDARTPSERDEARAHYDAIHSECVVFTEGDEQ